MPEHAAHDLTGPTAAGHSWRCACCPFRTDDLDEAVAHAADTEWADTGTSHMLHELPHDAKASRSRDARRCLYRHHGHHGRPYIARRNA